MFYIFRFLSRLPLAWLHKIGAFLGLLTWLVSPTYRRHMRENMQLALGADGEARERFAAILHAGKAALELPRIWMRSHADASALIVQISGSACVEEAKQRGKGIIYLTPHLGCFEITAQYLSQSAPLTVLYRPPKQAWLQKLVQTGRIRDTMQIATADLAGVRILLKALKRGEAIGILPDQAPQAGEGLWLDFFSRPAYTMTLAARLAETGASIILCAAERLPHGRGFHFHLAEPTKEITGTTKERAEEINRQIESLIRRYPAQYLWGYNRYKHPSGAPLPP